MGRSPERRHGRSDDALRAHRSEDELAWQGPHGSILLVDCFADEQELYREYLRHAGFDPIVACEAASALAIAVEHHPAVIVVDFTIPDDAATLIQRLRDEARARDAIIIVISGRVYPADRAAAERAGCDVFLPKPCPGETLVSEIRTAMTRRAQDRDADRRADAL